MYTDLTHPRSDDGMHLINEQNDLSVALLDFLQDRLEPFLELSSHGGSSNKGTEVQSDETTRWLELVRHITCDHPLCDSLGNGGLSDTRVSNQDRIVLCPAGQDLDGAANLIITANHWVEFALFGLLCKVNTIFEKGVVVVFCPTGGSRA